MTLVQHSRELEDVFKVSLCLWNLQVKIPSICPFKGLWLLQNCRIPSQVKNNTIPLGYQRVSVGTSLFWNLNYQCISYLYQYVFTVYQSIELFVWRPYARAKTKTNLLCGILMDRIHLLQIKTLQVSANISISYSWVVPATEYMSDSRLSPGQSNAVSHWLGANLESAVRIYKKAYSSFASSQLETPLQSNAVSHWLGET